jgi:hypothetical protein
VSLLFQALVQGVDTWRTAHYPCPNSPAIREILEFAVSFKLTFTRDGDKTIPIIAGSCFNCIVTNNEKIRIQRPNARNGRHLHLIAGTRE